MPTVRFTDNIQRHVNCPTRVVDGARVRDVLDAYFQANAQARGYVLDEQGRLREHMAIFVDGGDSWQAVSSNLPPIHSVRLVKGA